VGARIVDNRRVKLADSIREEAPKHSKLSVATGYWDLLGMQEVFDSIENYESIRILIGQEPMPPAYAPRLDLNDLDASFPEDQIKQNLESISHSNELRELVTKINALIQEGRLEVKVYRGSFLHAKAYIFGDKQSKEAVGIIGSSNFTRAGLTSNIELNALEDDARIVKSTPAVITDEHGHLSWFEEMWNAEESEVWDGTFRQILEASPVGDYLFPDYLMYIKALYEIYEDELIPDSESLSYGIEDVLYDFQLRNAKLLLRKLTKNGLAMLADSVGLGKTITAGAVIRHYVEELGARRVYVIAPANLTTQWRDDLARVHGLLSGFEVISMQNLELIRQERAIDKYAGVDLFVIDEAHNLRSGGGTRHDELLDWFSENPDSHVLLLTATPINNSLADFVNQIQLASKGKLDSFPVVYPTSKKTEVIDFFEAVKRLSKDIASAEKEGKKPDFDKVNRVMRQGLRHFLVRTTRSGIEKEFGGIRLSDGRVWTFPESHVIPTPYKFSTNVVAKLDEVLYQGSRVFEGIDPKRLNIAALLEMTQRSQHPLENLKKEPQVADLQTETPFDRIFQVLLLLGFAPYKAETYKHRFYGKAPEEIASFKLSPEESFRINSQLSIHNMMRVNLLKRLESSQFALRKSIENYQNRLEEFERLLNAGQILAMKDIRTLRAQFGDDLDIVDFDDEGNGFESTPADPEIFNLEAIRIDLERDKGLIGILIGMCDELAKVDDKLESFANLIRNLRESKPAGKKILVFSYYTDTIEYLQSVLGSYYPDEALDAFAAFTVGNTKGQIEKLAKRFSPNSKSGSDEVKLHGEIDLLFASDVLSEGQNLQDCGILINFDLHWNPVRMIQRNGRINRLGSPHEEIFIYNVHPDVDLDAYLTLVNRLERKIDRIRYTVGTDQSVLGENANPIEFIDEIEEDKNIASVAVALYDSDSADEVLKQFDDDAELLSEDEFIMDLRAFERDATEVERKQLARISRGKWGALSASAAEKLDGARALSLVRVESYIDDQPKSLVSHIFLSTTDSVGAVETISALGAIRNVNGNVREEHDRINLDRDRISSRARKVAKSQVTASPAVFRITPSVNRVLDAMKMLKPELSLYEALTRISTKQEHKKAKSLIDRAYRDLKSQSSVSEGVTVGLEDLHDRLIAKPTLERKIPDEGVVAVLHFGR